MPIFPQRPIIRVTVRQENRDDILLRYLRIRNIVEPVGCILAAPGTPSTSPRLSGEIKRGPTHRYTKVMETQRGMALDPSCVIAPTAVQVGDRTRHHIAVRLLPFLFVLYIANYLDRANLAYAALGMSRDLGFSDRVIGLGVGVDRKSTRLNSSHANISY